MDMKNSASYEWCVEWIDAYGDVHDHDYSNQLKDVWPPQYTESRDEQNLTPVPCHIRHYGCEAEGEIERGYAYKGDKQYCSGHKVKPYIVMILEYLT